jgi:hypothetical protein
MFDKAIQGTKKGSQGFITKLEKDVAAMSKQLDTSLRKAEEELCVVP